MAEVLHLLEHGVQITGFVIVMMLVIEYLNVVTSGSWQQLAGRRWGQYLITAALGATPGCLGAFAVVAMYSHRVVTVGAVVTAMIATSGDASFVMLAMVPRQALLVTGVLLVLGIIAGILTDVILAAIRRRRSVRSAAECDGLELHEEERCECFPRGQILRQWRECSAARGVLAIVLVLFVTAVAAGQIGADEETWIRITLIVASSLALFIVATVPDHFLDEHLWKHVALKHAPRVFLWTAGALIAVHVLVERVQIDETIRQGKWLVLLVACLTGLIPESGPHLIFVTLFARGAVPMSVLLANSIVQDGHGMLPLLAHSRRVFFGVKLVNLVVGLVVGTAVMAAGY